MKKSRKKLSLHVETLRQLTSSESRQAAGAAESRPESRCGSCPCLQTLEGCPTFGDTCNC